MPRKVPLTHGLLKEILSEVKYLDWKWLVMDKGDGFLIQLAWIAPDADTGKQSLQKSRKWYVSSHVVKSEIVQTAYAAVQRAVLHEVAESFTYRGKRIFNPHFDVEALINVDGVEKRQ